MALEKIQVPDIGDEQEVEVIEVLVKVGDSVSENDSLIVLESDKAAMEIPSPTAGVVKEILVKVGDQVSQGSAILSLDSESAAEAGATDDEAEKEKAAETQEEQEEGQKEGEKEGQNDGQEQSVPDQAPAASAEASKPASTTTAAGGTSEQDIKVPDLGGDEGVEVIDILVAIGDEIKAEDGLVTLESDKAAMDVPSPAAGKVTAINMQVGDKVSAGDLILTLETTAATGDDTAEATAPATAAEPATAAAAVTEVEHAAEASPEPAPPPEVIRSGGEAVYAGPAVRKMARELGVDLAEVKGSGARGRVVKEDVQAHVKARMQSAAAPAATGAGLPGIEDIDFSQFGEIEDVALTKLHQVTARNMSRNWLNVPHVTQFEEADVTDLEEFREAQKDAAEKKGVKLTPLPFIVKACARALAKYPQFNVSLHSSGTKLIRKQYIHIGVAVATPAGLMVPVVRDADRKSIWEIAAEIADLGAKAKDRKLTKDEMQGACFTVSSLGNLGGTGFTPIVNAPEVAILGVSKTAVKPVFIGGEFVPRKMLPFALSYDHRAVNGVDGGMFCNTLSQLLSDIRLLAL